jgi:hypothetical protein
MAKGGAKPGERRGGRKAGVPNKATLAPDVKALAGQYTDVAVRVLREIAEDEKAPAAARVSASNSLLDRAHGKASQTIEGSFDGVVEVRIRR